MALERPDPTQIKYHCDAHLVVTYTRINDDIHSYCKIPTQVGTLRELHRMALERPDPAAFAGWAVSIGLLPADQLTRFLDRCVP